MNLGKRWWWVPVLVGALACGSTLAENVDPGNNDSQYAYGENIGWLNAEPSGNGGPGMHVFDFEVTGWMWGENTGWVSLSCKNTSSCGVVSYGVGHDGNGTLSGYAWSENLGWLNFLPTGAGVTIDPATGMFGGKAWGENAGWVSFASLLGAYRMMTGWTCSPPPPSPMGSPTLRLGKSGSDAVLSWTGVLGGTGADVVRGRLAALRATGGDFNAATDACLVNDTPDTDLTDASPLGVDFWYVVRPVNCGGPGTYDTGEPSQVGLRDAEINSAVTTCP